MPQHAIGIVVSVSSGADLRLSSPRRLLRLDHYAYYTVGLVRYRCGQNEPYSLPGAQMTPPPAFTSTGRAITRRSAAGSSEKSRSGSAVGQISMHTLASSPCAGGSADHAERVASVVTNTEVHR